MKTENGREATTPQTGQDALYQANRRLVAEVEENKRLRAVNADLLEVLDELVHRLLTQKPILTIIGKAQKAIAKAANKPEGSEGGTDD